ncbi:MAG: cobalamin-dependent protein [Lachnospiraceae bacterium]|nr:cobalamin-dependent protein [Lachnospiraceae bacterium]
MENKRKSLRKAIVSGNVAKTSMLCKELVENQTNPQDIINEVLIPSMSDVSIYYENGKMFIPQLLLASKAFNECIRILKKKQVQVDFKGVDRQKVIVVGTIKGDIHSIGKNLVSFLLQSYGYQVIDLGINVSVEQFVESIQENHADCVIISAMLSSALIHLSNAIRVIQNTKFEKEPYILIGGALITEDFARENHVDYGYTAVDTLSKIVDRFQPQ